jgi:ribosome-binding factor A
MSADRMRRVNEAVREVLSDAIKLLKDPRVVGSAEERAATMEGLASAHGVLQTVVNRELRMKRTPTLDFVYDDTAERADRMERILADREHKS